MSIHDSNSEPTTPGSLSPTPYNSNYTPALPDETRTFNFFYSIDAELSHFEYEKLVKVISVLQEQKRKWSDRMDEAHEKLDQIKKENNQLSNNNHILRESLEAANKAIKEINGKVHELKETLVPLRNENAALRAENDELIGSMEDMKRENNLINKDAEGLQKMRFVYEEKIATKDQETEEFKTDMHEKFKKLEELYRNYQQDMEVRNTKLIREGEELRKIYEAMSSEIEALRKENSKFKKETEEFRENNEHLEAELRRKRNTNIKLLHNSKEKEKLSESAQEMEDFYKKEVEESNKALIKTRSDIEKYKEEARYLEESNSKLKQDYKELESQLRVIETKNKEIFVTRSSTQQQVEFLENEVEMIKRENKMLESIKQDKIDLEINQKTYISRIQELEQQTKEVDNLKREQFSQQNENQRMKAEISQLESALHDYEKVKRTSLTEKFENERLKSELQHLQKQLQLLEDQQKLTQGPFNADLKAELERIRSQMNDLAVSNKDRRLELYTNELKGELASLKDQIKELDTSNRQSTSIHYSNSVQSEFRSNVSVTEFDSLHPNRPSSASSESTQSSSQNQQPQLQQQSPLHQQQPQDTTQFQQQPPQLFQQPEQQQESGVKTSVDKKDFTTQTESSPQQHARPLSSSGDSTINVRSDDNEVFVASDVVVSVVERNVNTTTTTTSRNTGRSRSAGSAGEELNRIYVSKSTEMGKPSADGVQQQQDEKQRQIEERIRRKREKNTDWSLRTPSIDKMRRKSVEELTSTSLYDDEDDVSGVGFVDRRRRRRERSPSIGRRSRSNDPKTFQDGEFDDVEQPSRRGRSPRRKERASRGKDVGDGAPGPGYGYNSQYDVKINGNNTRPYTSIHQYSVAGGGGYGYSMGGYNNQHFNQQQQRSRAKSEERIDRTGRVRKQHSSSSMYIDDTSSEDFEYHRVNGDYSKSLDYRRSLRGPPQSHDVNQMLLGAMTFRQRDACSKNPRGGYSQNIISPQDKYGHNRSTGQILEQFVSHKIQQQKQKQQRPEESPLHMPRQPKQQQVVGNGRFYPQREYSVETRRHTSPNKENRVLMGNQQQYRQQMNNNNIDFHRAKTLDKDFRTTAESKSMQHEKRVHHHSTQKEEMIRSIKAEQALKLTLTPTEIDHYGRTNQHVTSRQQHPTTAAARHQHLTTATTTKKQSIDRKRDSYNEQELVNQEKMERARQHMLSKMQQEKQGGDVRDGGRVNKNTITRSGIPMQRRSKQTDGSQGKRGKPSNGNQAKYNNNNNNNNNNNGTNKFISEEEAEKFYSQQQNNHLLYQQHDRIARTNSQGRNRDELNIFRGQNGEKFKTLSGNHQEERSTATKVHRSKEIEKTQQKQQQQHFIGGEQIEYRSRQPSNGSARARPKSGEFHYRRPKSGEFQRPKSGEYEKVRGATGHHFIERTSSASSKQQHRENYHCDICKKLNKNKADGEPTRYCWERYYAVSSSTPTISSAQSFQQEF